MSDARTMLERMAHRGACACDNDSGDGAGVLTAIPHELYKKAVMECDFGFFILKQLFLIFKNLERIRHTSAFKN